MTDSAVQIKRCTDPLKLLRGVGIKVWPKSYSKIVYYSSLPGESSRKKRRQSRIYLNANVTPSRSSLLTLLNILYSFLFIINCLWSSALRSPLLKNVSSLQGTFARLSHPAAWTLRSFHAFTYLLPESRSTQSRHQRPRQSCVWAQITPCPLSSLSLAQAPTPFYPRTIRSSTGWAHPFSSAL